MSEKPSAPVPASAAPPAWSGPAGALLARLGATPRACRARRPRPGWSAWARTSRAARPAPPVVEFLGRFAIRSCWCCWWPAPSPRSRGDLTSAAIIAAIVLLSVTLDFVQEHRAGDAAERLRRSVAPARPRAARRHGAGGARRQLVPGDVVLLAAGSLVPADARLLEARDFFVNQSLLTGEPYPVEKHPGRGPGGRRAPPRRATPSSWAPPSSAARRGRSSSPRARGPVGGASPRTLTQRAALRRPSSGTCAASA